ncbi:PD-(D/E)XK nuclease-like domain-containing protein [Streptomyces poriferorum]|uniref:PD-(D/E)XK nuclease-like domain-containing protein n=1 Tax=Streptomyces poriferorum TaxID=2798799 RepID=A0ABY9IY98_9ACTN|nr:MULTISPECIES: PD-(D/E)XK nuclease-like domain-containing protein [unclassified Streptomyces]MDP5310465.1 PD-(D/E)XK nuclease-like domain-containing protein [Streptomyces sp. Alt4]WLQ60381.1 PD-(D/E)XK nuclease-like domain-containing protein [Streptomyces sp. Alt2]
MTTTLEPPVTTAPVVIDGMSAEDYHADRTSISSTGLRKLLNPGCPAQFKYDRDHPQPHKKEFDLGHAAHLLVLGEGPELEVIDAPDWKKVATRELRDEAYADGKVPLLRKDHDMVQAMAEAIRQHPLAGPLFQPGIGTAEQSIFWTDPATGVRCRIRPDWLKQLPGLTLCVDYKTIKAADPDTVSKAIRDHGYHQQDPFYIDGIWAALQPEDVRFIFVFQSKVAPYLVTVRELADQNRDIGRAKNERALRIYADCEATGIWPDWTGPVTDIPTISMPTWAVLNESEEYLK